MDEDDFMKWQQHHMERLMEGFIDKMEVQFEEYCIDRYASDQAADSDALYEAWKESVHEVQNEPRNI